MRLPVAAEYAIRGIVHIAKNKGGPVTVRQIASAELIPRNYLIKIFKSLVAAGLIRPHRGKSGGFSLGADPATVTLRRIIEAIQGPILFNDCLLAPGRCDADSWCPAHPVWQRIQKSVCDILDSVTLAEIAGREAGHIRGTMPPEESDEADE
jgi:Rrf2 family iron-sulfur cluster assembly transcriptional regulator